MQLLFARTTVCSCHQLNGAQAAVAVVRLTSDGRGKKGPEGIKRLVKLQALVRGFLVRKRVATTIYSMQALLRAQLAVRSQRTLLPLSDLVTRLT
ncbi:protein IQ-DOMAIN 14 [Tanacetum coccineum]